MKQIQTNFNDLVASVPKEVKTEVDMEFGISNRIYQLMQERGLSKEQLACELGTRASEVTKWLSGQYNFSTRTLARLSSFFDQKIVAV